MTTETNDNVATPEDGNAPETTPKRATLRTVTINGKSYPLAVLGMPEVGQLRAWAKRQQPDLMATIQPYLATVDERSQRMMIDRALEDIRRPIAFGSEEFNGAIQTGEGMREVLWLSLKRGGADVIRADCDAAADALSIEEAGDVYVVALGS